MINSQKILFFWSFFKLFKNLPIFFFLFYLFISSIAFSQGAAQKKTFAVLEFEGTGVPDQTMQDVSDRFAKEYALFKEEQFILINREQMRKTLQEQNIRIFGCSSFKCGLEAGNTLDVDYVIIGSLTKNGPVYSLKAQLIDVENSKTISRAEYDNIIGDILTVMSKEVKKAAAFLASAKIEIDIIQTKVVEGLERRLIILPIEITLDQTFEQEKISELVNVWIRGEVTFSQKAKLIDFDIDKSKYIALIFDNTKVFHRTPPTKFWDWITSNIPEKRRVTQFRISWDDYDQTSNVQDYVGALGKHKKKKKKTKKKKKKKSKGKKK